MVVPFIARVAANKFIVLQAITVIHFFLSEWPGTNMAALCIAATTNGALVCINFIILNDWLSIILVVHTGALSALDE